MAFIVFIGDIDANHIIGGTMRYICLGDGNYRIRINMYRDCLCTNCADFDTDASIAVYNCGLGIDCSTLDQSDLVGHVKLNVRAKRDVEAPELECLIPPEVCVTEAQYVFNTLDSGIVLIPNGEPYVFTNQRCCRNSGINNLVQPSQEQGSSFSIIITPEALNVCNDSPIFNSFPPTIICNNEEVAYDHGARDIDGDSLIYYFCAPFNGGGQSGNFCAIPKPDPSCPPDISDGSYNKVNYQSPYSGEKPLPGTLTIDRQTGLLSGAPNQIGRFVVGVCIDEYRDNNRLSVTRRDFQFNIEDCDPEVDAIMNGEAIDNGQEYVYDICGELDVEFVNQSVQRELIEDWYWKFDINGSPLEITTWDASVQFPDTGTYAGLLVLNPTSGCGDSAVITVNIYGEVESKFDFRYDTCFGFPIQFLSTSYSVGGGLIRHFWEFGDGEFSAAREPSHLYDFPGQYNVGLTVVDKNGCEDYSDELIDFFPVPLNIVIDPILSDICAPVTARFNNLSRPLDSTYTILWDFGDGETSGEVSPEHMYQEDGSYDVSVVITSPNGCEQDQVFLDFISLIESPEAAFDFSPNKPKIGDPVVLFTDQSQRANSVRWDFAGLNSSSLRDPTYSFPDTGRFLVSQFAFHENGCIDTAQTIVFIRPDFSYFLPNAFTPNGDGINDVYLGLGKLIGIQDFRFTIWNRWGERIFETNDPQQGWNGRKDNQGILAQPGVYLCYVNFIDGEGNAQEIKSYATLIQ